jgi:hypothetical protein
MEDSENGGKGEIQERNRIVVNLPREKVEREVLSCRWSSTSRKWNSAPMLGQPFSALTNSLGRIHPTFAIVRRIRDGGPVIRALIAAAVTWLARARA